VDAADAEVLARSYPGLICPSWTWAEDEASILVVSNLKKIGVQNIIVKGRRTGGRSCAFGRYAHRISDREAALQIVPSLVFFLFISSDQPESGDGGVLSPVSILGLA
jgi:adenine deaminase